MLALASLWRKEAALFAAIHVVTPLVQAGVAEAPTDRFYDPAVVQEIHVTVKPEDFDRMKRALPQRLAVPATFRWKDQTLEFVGVRYKGNSSTAPESPFKRGFHFSFAEFKAGQRFLGLRHVDLDNGIQFGSVFSERLITEVLRRRGVKAARCNYARLFLNGRYAGLYVNVERIDRTFLQRCFGSDRGPLFKVNEGGPGADLQWVGNDPALYRKTFERHTGHETKAFAALLDFVRRLNSPGGTEAELRRLLDVEAFVKTTAVLLLAGAFDQYTGWGPHNYYLYCDPADQRWTYIPWDLDVGFADQAFGRVPVLEGWHAAWPVPVPGRPLLEQLVTHTNLLQEYRRQAKLILEEEFQPDVLIPKLRAVYGQIRADLERDPFPPRRATVPSDRGYDDILASMETFIRRRYELARAQLDAPGKRPMPKPMPASLEPQGPSPGPSSPDAPSDLRVANVTAAAVELRWTNHANGAMACVVQRCTGADATDFVNAIGQPGSDVTAAVDRAVQPGTTYRYRVYAVTPTPQGPRGTGVSNVVTVTIPNR